MSLTDVTWFEMETTMELIHYDCVYYFCSGEQHACLNFMGPIDLLVCILSLTT